MRATFPQGTVSGAGTSRITADGRFALGFPRVDGGEEINARVVVRDWGLADLQHAFGLDDWPMTGTHSLIPPPCDRARSCCRSMTRSLRSCTDNSWPCHVLFMAMASKLQTSTQMLQRMQRA